MRIKKQIDVKDCGLNVVEALHHHFYKTSLNIEKIKSESNISEKGMNVQSLIDLAKNHGIIMEAFEAPFEAINQNQNEYMIAIVENNGLNHYVIFVKQNNLYTIFDPEKGKYKLTVEEFAEKYRGMVITVLKENVSHPKNEKAIKEHFLLDNASIIIWALVSVMGAVILSFVSTIYSKILFDLVLPGKLEKELSILSFSFLFLVLIRVLNNLFKRFLIQKIEIALELNMQQKFLNKIKEVPIIVLEKFSQNDLIRRSALISPISSFIASGAFLIFNEVVVLVISVALLLYISPQLFAITFSVALLASFVTFVVQLISNRESEKLSISQLESFDRQTAFINSFRNIKSSNEYIYFFEKQQKSMMELKERELRIFNVFNWSGLVNGLINLGLPIVLMYLSTKMVFNNTLSIGTMMLFLGLFNSFISPTLQLADFFGKFNINYRNWKLISSILKMESEEINEKGYKAEKIKNFSCENLEFSFDKKLLSLKNFCISENAIISGKNGSGKSTLLKILSLSYPLENLKINNIEVPYYYLTSLRDRMIYISPETNLSNDSLINQITLNNKQARTRFESFANQLNPILERMSLNLNGISQNGGMNLSSGQRQVIKLLRLFAFQYDCVFLDEAFENIDRETFEFFKEVLPTVSQNTIWIEVSHSKKYLFPNAKEVNIDEINSN